MHPKKLPNPILVTGCSSGIGHHLALRLKQDGYSVIATCRKNTDSKRLTEAGLDCYQLDLDSSQSIHRLITHIKEQYNGQLYALINNGAYGQPGAVEDLSRAALRAQFETNVFGTQELTNHVLPLMHTQGAGRIIQISSILGLLCMHFRGAYNASKYALEALSDTLRLELHGSNIHISLIEPGPIESNFRINSWHKYKANIDTKNSTYYEQYKTLEARLTSEDNAAFTLPPEAVYKAVRHALTSRRPKIRYPVTLPTQVLGKLKRWMPDRWMDTLLTRSNKHS